MGQQHSRGHITYIRIISGAHSSGDLEDYATETHKAPTSESPQQVWELSDLTNTQRQVQKGR